MSRSETKHHEIISLILFFSPLTVTNPTSQTDLNLSSDHQELKFEFERVQDENASLKQQLAIQTEVKKKEKRI